MANVEMNVLKVGNSEFEIADAKARQDCSDLKENFYDSLVTDTASGSIASFSDGADNVPVKSLAVAIEPVQSGSGDPSPDNVRPISGHTSAVVTRCGKNLLDGFHPISLEVGATQDGDKYTLPNTYSAVRFIADVKPNAQYIVSADVKNVVNQTRLEVTKWVNGADGGLIRRRDINSGTSIENNFTTDSTTTQVRLTFYITVSSPNGTEISKPQLELGSTVTAYEVYQSNTYEIDLNGTRYGGTLDVTTGVLTVDRKYALLNDPDKWTEGSGTVTYAYNQTFTDRKTYGDSYIGLTCSMMPVKSSQTRFTARWMGATSPYFGLAFSATSPEVSLTDIKALASNGDISIAYDIEPQTVQLTAQEVRTLLGTNNVFADCGDVSVEYRADTKLYIQKVISG